MVTLYHELSKRNGWASTPQRHHGAPSQHHLVKRVFHKTKKKRAYRQRVMIKEQVVSRKSSPTHNGILCKVSVRSASSIQHPASIVP